VAATAALATATAVRHTFNLAVDPLPVDTCSSSGAFCELDAIWNKKLETSSSFNSKRLNTNTNKALMQAVARDRVFDLTGRTGDHG
jgi:hypothetical protein